MVARTNPGKQTATSAMQKAIQQSQGTKQVCHSCGMTGVVGKDLRDSSIQLDPQGHKENNLYEGAVKIGFQCIDFDACKLKWKERGS